MVCPSCQYGKSHRLPFSKSKNRVSAVLQLVHLYLMCPNPSYSSFHCDSYCGRQFTWVYFLGQKSEAISKFIQFKEKVETEFRFPIKCLHTKMEENTCLINIMR